MKNTNEKNKGEGVPGILKHAGCSLSSLFWLIIAIAFAYWIFQNFDASTDVPTISYSEFRQQFKMGMSAASPYEEKRSMGFLNNPLNNGTASNQLH